GARVADALRTGVTALEVARDRAALAPDMPRHWQQRAPDVYRHDETLRRRTPSRARRHSSYKDIGHRCLLRSVRVNIWHKTRRAGGLSPPAHRDPPVLVTRARALSFLA